MNRAFFKIVYLTRLFSALCFALVSATTWAANEAVNHCGDTVWNNVLAPIGEESRPYSVREDGVKESVGDWVPPHKVFYEVAVKSDGLEVVRVIHGPSPNHKLLLFEKMTPIWRRQTKQEQVQWFIRLLEKPIVSQRVKWHFENGKVHVTSETKSLLTSSVSIPLPDRRFIVALVIRENDNWGLALQTYCDISLLFEKQLYSHLYLPEGSGDESKVVWVNHPRANNLDEFKRAALEAVKKAGASLTKPSNRSQGQSSYGIH